MAKENLVQKLKKKVTKKILPCVLSGAMLVGGLFPHYSCSNNFTDPSNPDNPQKPVAMLTANPTEGDAPLFVEFDGSLSYSDIEKYYWDFDGDGNTDVISENPTINHTYDNGGKYNSSLFVENSQGQKSDKKLLEIIVNEEIVSLGKIAFWSNYDSEGSYNEDIYSAEIIHRTNDDKIELRDIKRLTTDSGKDLEPTWSPDGTEILFTSHRTGGTAIWKMNANGDNQEDISSNLVERARQADWGSNGLIVVAYRDFGDTVAGIGTINPDENLFTPLYSESISGKIPRWPDWSPDCSKIAFQKYINGNWEIFSMNADGTNLENLTNNPSENEEQPRWSPDGEGIFFRKGEAYYLDFESNIPEQITFNIGALDPAISLDGNKLIFTGQIGWYNLYMQELLSGNLTRLTFSEIPLDPAYRYPAWKPNIEDLNFN